MKLPRLVGFVIHAEADEYANDESVSLTVFTNSLSEEVPTSVVHVI